MDVVKKRKTLREKLNLFNNSTKQCDENQSYQSKNVWLCGNRNETIDHIISKCSKLVQKEYKTRHNWVGKVIHWELCKKFKFDQKKKWYLHNPESIQENETHKLLWDFEIQTDHLISTRRPDLIIVNKRRRSAEL